MPNDITTPVLRNRDLGNGNFLVEFSIGDLAASMKPAQFFMIGIPGSETLLRRPYSVCGLPGTFEDGAPGAVQVLYKVVGTGTGLLSRLKPGAELTVLGPLGNGFEPPEPGVRAVFVAGGIGSAPFPALTRRFSAEGIPTTLFYGARGERDLPLLEWFREHCDETHVSTDDGSSGHHGVITEPLAAWLDGVDPGSIHLYACGPDPMLHAVGRMAVARGLRCDLSLEAHMACGFGVCLGCVVPTRHPGDDAVRYDRVCVEGPVMPAERMAW